jgi:hypothetical protein
MKQGAHKVLSAVCHNPHADEYQYALIESLNAQSHTSVAIIH